LQLGQVAVAAVEQVAVTAVGAGGIGSGEGGSSCGVVLAVNWAGGSTCSWGKWQ
jgi:hypothetical protein